MEFDVGQLFLASAIGSVGFVAFVYGKRQRRVPQLVAGLLLMVFPYFVASLAWMTVIAVLILALMWGAIRYGL